MKAVVTIDNLVLGGGVITAIELAAAVRDQCGWDIAIHAAPAPLEALIRDRGLRLLPAPENPSMVSTRNIRALRAVCRAEQPDLVHAWGPKPVFTAFVAAYLAERIPTLGSICEMFVPPQLPPAIPISFVTRDLVRRARTRGGISFLQEPPINFAQDDPTCVDAGAFRAEHGLDDSRLQLVIVTRLDYTMKREGVLRSVDAVRRLGSRLPVDLVVVGDGDARDDIEAAAATANADLGREAVRLLGAMGDPRGAYAAADVVIGMGTSAVRGMAFNKPVIVVGEDGYSETFRPETSEALGDSGFYGFGNGDPDNAELCRRIEELVTNDAMRHSLGESSRALVVARFDLDVIGGALGEWYDKVVATPVDRSPAVLARASTAAAIKIYHQTRHLAGRIVHGGPQRYSSPRPEPVDNAAT
jgi:L-malate glycosyltransferase